MNENGGYKMGSWMYNIATSTSIVRSVSLGGSDYSGNERIVLEFKGATYIGYDEGDFYSNSTKLFLVPANSQLVFDPPNLLPARLFFQAVGDDSTLHIWVMGG